MRHLIAGAVPDEGETKNMGMSFVRFEQRMSAHQVTVARDPRAGHHARFPHSAADTRDFARCIGINELRSVDIKAPALQGWLITTAE